MEPRLNKILETVSSKCGERREEIGERKRERERVEKREKEEM